MCPNIRFRLARIAAFLGCIAILIEWFILPQTPILRYFRLRHEEFGSEAAFILPRHRGLNHVISHGFSFHAFLRVLVVAE
jgi:hypothetical protein